MVGNMLALAVLFSFVLAKPHTRTSMIVHEAIVSPPSGYVRTTTPDAATTISLRIALTQQDATGLIAALYNVSDPQSAHYGAHLSKEEVRAHTHHTITQIQAFR